MTDTGLVIKNILLCDDVRKEENGKLQFIGIYEQDIVFANLPAQMSLRLVVFAHAKSAGIVELKIRSELGKTKMFEGQANLTVLKAGNVILPFPPLPLKFDDQGILKIFASIAGDDWKEVWSGEVHKSVVVQSIPL